MAALIAASDLSLKANLTTKIQKTTTAERVYDADYD
jgi:hypothetical protein